LTTAANGRAHHMPWYSANTYSPAGIPFIADRNIVDAGPVYARLPANELSMCSLPSVDFRAAVLLGFATAMTVSPADAMFIVNQPWVRPAQVGQATEAYMDLTSTDGATLVGVATNAAKAATIRAPGKAMVTAKKVTLPPQALVALAPGKYRIALTHLLRTLKVGDRVAMQLTIELADGSRQDIPVNAEVRQHSPIDDEHRAHTHPPH
jgi:periplasmic copper chaperone A